MSYKVLSHRQIERNYNITQKSRKSQKRPLALKGHTDDTDDTDFTDLLCDE